MAATRTYVTAKNDFLTFLSISTLNVIISLLVFRNIDWKSFSFQSILRKASIESTYSMIVWVDCDYQCVSNMRTNHVQMDIVTLSTTKASHSATHPICDSEDYLNIETSAIFIGFSLFLSIPSLRQFSCSFEFLSFFWLCYCHWIWLLGCLVEWLSFFPPIQLAQLEYWIHRLYG